ncbi:hypothetical protein Tco_0784449 [Tanacetum coccineum]
MVTIPPSTGNFSIPWAVDGTARIAEIPKIHPGCCGVLLIANHNRAQSLEAMFVQYVCSVALSVVKVGKEMQSRIPIVKVQWNSRRGPEFTWERKDQFQKKYPHLFTKTAPSSSAAS